MSLIPPVPDDQDVSKFYSIPEKKSDKKPVESSGDLFKPSKTEPAPRPGYTSASKQPIRSFDHFYQSVGLGEALKDTTRTLVDMCNEAWSSIRKNIPYD